MGSAIAFFLKQRAPDLKITVLERDWNVREEILDTTNDKMTANRIFDLKGA